VYEHTTLTSLPLTAFGKQFYKFCDALTASSHGHALEAGEKRKREIVDNYARWIVEHEVKKCPAWEKKGAIEKVRSWSWPLFCISTHAAADYRPFLELISASRESLAAPYAHSFSRT
jgi:hypothetical protein